MVQITDQTMETMLATTKAYSVMTLKPGPNYSSPDAPKIIWEHGRRNFSLRADGVLRIVCPISDGTDVCGIGIFNVADDAARALMDDDPGVKAGVFTYEVHPSRSFPGDALT